MNSQFQIIKEFRNYYSSRKHYLKNITENDIFLVSYPKSGNTWLRVVLHYLLFPDIELETLRDINKSVPDIHVNIPKKSNVDKIRVIKTHRSYENRDLKENPELYRKVIYLIRNPLNVIPSYYSFFTQSNKMDVNEFIKKMAYGHIGPGNWQDHVMGWLGHFDFNDSEYLILKYEDCVKDKIKMIKKLASFIEITINEEHISKIIKSSSKDKMIHLEKKLKENKNYQFVNPKNIRGYSEKPSYEVLKLFKDLNSYTLNLFDYA